MRKITSLLSLLFMMMGGVMFAQQAQTEITDLKQLSNDKTYTLVAKRGFIGVKESKAIFGYAGTPNLTRPQTNDDRFAILKHEEKYYLFNVGKKQFVNVEQVQAGGYNTMSLKDTPDYYFSINATNNNEYPWCFRVPDNNNWLMNMGGSRQVAVDNWNTLDDGNQFKITEVGTLDKETLDAALSKLVVDYAALINNAYDAAKLNMNEGAASLVGYISNDQKNTIDAAKATALQNASKESYEAFLKVIKDNSVGFEANAYYLIENQNGITKKYPSTQNMHFHKEGDKLPFSQPYDDRVVRRVDGNAPILPRLWKVELQDDGKYGIKNANTNCRWANYKGSGELDMPADPNNQDFGHCVIEQIPVTNQDFNTKFYIKINGSIMNAFNGDRGTALQVYNNITDGGGFWSFKKVTEVPVNIGATGWASVCMPFAVTIPASVQAYVATSAENDVVTLTEVKGTVPAKTAMLITGVANSSANFAISTETGQTIAKNLFKGTTTERINFQAEETFALGANGEKVALMKNALEKTFTWKVMEGEGDQAAEVNKEYKTIFVPANKAYILTTDLSATAQAASMLQFNFGGEATGIDGVVADDAKETIYYDLNGRRVLYPTQGVYVTNTGKKVFIR